MKKRDCFFTKQQSLMLRGIAIFMVMLCHYANWYAERLNSEMLHYGLSRLGVYGVDLFFLVSGYGLVKSVQKKGIDFSFITNRLKNTYLPYLVIVGVIEIYGGGLREPAAWYRFLTAYDYWYIRNIMIFYLVFFLVFLLLPKRSLQTAALFAALLAYSILLMKMERGSFWYVSNIAFVIGVCAAQYERELLKAADFAYPVQVIVLTVCMVLAAKNGMDNRFVPMNAVARIPGSVLAGGVWTLLGLQAACLLPEWLGILRISGKLSLELYLLHSFLYYRVCDNLTGIGGIGQGAAALMLTFIAAWLVNRLFDFIFAKWKAV